MLHPGKMVILSDSFIPLRRSMGEASGDDHLKTGIAFEYQIMQNRNGINELMQGLYDASGRSYSPFFRPFKVPVYGSLQVLICRMK